MASEHTPLGDKIQPIASAKNLPGVAGTTTEPDPEDHDGARDQQSDEARQAISTHAFFRPFKKEVIFNLSKVARRWTSLSTGVVVVQEGHNLEQSGDCLWALSRGSVKVMQAESELGLLEAGSIVGDSVVFGRLDREPFTVIVEQAPCIAWCIPQFAIQQATKQNPTALPQLEDFMDHQARKLLWPRAVKMIMFSHCSPNFTKHLSKKFKVIYHHPEHALWKPATVPRYMQVVVSGKVRIERCDAMDQAGAKKTMQISMLPRKKGAGAKAASNKAQHGHSSSNIEKSLAEALGNEEVQEEESDDEASSEEEAEGHDDAHDDHDHDHDPGLPSARMSWSVKHLHRTRMGKLNGEEDESSGESSFGEEDDNSEEEPSGGSSDESESQTESSSDWDSDDSENLEKKEKYYELPDHMASFTSQRGASEAKAGPRCVVFGEAAVLGYQDTWSSEWKALSLTDCIVLTCTPDDWSSAVERFPRERRRFRQLGNSHYKEWQRCGVHRLKSVEVFSKCSHAFLIELALVAEPSLVFHGSSIAESNQQIDGMILLMEGHADQLRGDGTRTKVHAPISFGGTQWLETGGQGGEEASPRIKAKDFCQVLRITQSQLLQLLRDHPSEAGVMISQVIKTNGKRVTRSGAELKVSPMWYMPFCSKLHHGFLEELIHGLESFKLVPGQNIFRDMDGPDGDFLVVLTRGVVQVEMPNERPLEPSQEQHSVFTDGRRHRKERKHDAQSVAITEVAAPIIICGFDKSCRVPSTAKVLAEVYRLTVEKCSMLAANWPEETRIFMERMSTFQDRLEKLHSKVWWSSLNVLRRHEPFSGSSDDFLNKMQPLIRVRFVLPGEALVIEDDAVTHTVLLESGTAVIEQQKKSVSSSSHDRSGLISDSYLIGGIGCAYGFAGMQKRVATIHAKTVCKVIEVPIAGFLGLLKDIPSARQRFRSIAERRLQEMAPERLEDHQFFSNLSKSFVNTVRTKCQAKVFFEGEAIVRQGEPSDSMIIISANTVVTVMVDGRRVKDISHGATVGAAAVLSIQPPRRVATMLTQTVSTVRTLMRKDWVEALRNHAEHRSWIQTFTDEQLQLAETEEKDILRRREMTKVRQRETMARRAWCERLRGRDFDPDEAAKTPFRRKAVKTQDQMMRELQQDHTASRAPKPLALADVNLEHWECFNGKKAVVPHTRLPQLVMREGPSVEDKLQLDELEVSDVGRTETDGLLILPTQRDADPEDEPGRASTLAIQPRKRTSTGAGHAKRGSAGAGFVKRTSIGQGGVESVRRKSRVSILGGPDVGGDERRRMSMSLWITCESALGLSNMRRHSNI
mmetsp:Transcript_97146/g.173025  ORF Transcript_97146/g.173025 Transcript_97146/m.173025 type:complete len:1314 (+) Transcript_97146:117-4058(+)